MGDKSFADEIWGSLPSDDSPPETQTSGGSSFADEIWGTLPEADPLTPTELEPQLEEEPDPVLAGSDNETSLGGHFARGVDQLQGFGYSALEAAGEGLELEGLTDFGREGRERNIDEAAENPPSQSFSDANSAGDYATWAKETFVSQAPLMAPSLAGAGAGAVVGAPLGPIGATVGGVVGALVPSLVLGAGEVQQKIKEKDPEASAPSLVFGAGATIAALDSAFPGKMGSFLVKKLGTDIAEEVVKKALSKRLATEVPLNMTMEGTTEIVQSAISEAAASSATGAPIDWAEWKAGAVEEFAAGALMGGSITTAAEVYAAKKGASTPPEGDTPPSERESRVSSVVENHPAVKEIQDPAQQQAVVEAIKAMASEDGVLARIDSVLAEEGGSDVARSEVDVYLSEYIRDAVSEVAQDTAPPKGEPVPDTTSFGLNEEFPEAVAAAQKENLTPENAESLAAQMDAFESGRKPAVLITEGEPMPVIPEGAKVEEIPGRGQLIYRDEQTLEAAKNNKMGEALGLGIDEKPMTDQVVTARNSEGVVVTDTATDGRPEVVNAAGVLAGEGGTVEHRTVDEALSERTQGAEGGSFQSTVMADLEREIVRGQYAPVSDIRGEAAPETAPVTDKATYDEVQQEIDDLTDALERKYGDGFITENLNYDVAQALGKPHQLPEGYDTSDLDRLSSLQDKLNGIGDKELAEFKRRVVKDSGLPEPLATAALKVMGVRDSYPFAMKNLRGLGTSVPQTLTDLYNFFDSRKAKSPAGTSLDRVYAKFYWGGTGENPALMASFTHDSGKKIAADSEILTSVERIANAVYSARGEEPIDLSKTTSKPKKLDKSLDVKTPIDIAAHEAATSPTNAKPQPSEAQIEAGNYKKGDVKAFGLDIAVENPKGSTRSGVDTKGKPWETTMQHHYGYVKRSKGADGDAVDVFIGPKEQSNKAFIVDQKNENGKGFDEHKVILGAESQVEAEKIYDSNYAPDWKGRGATTEVTTDQLKEWVAKGDLTKPAKGQLNKTRERVSAGDKVVDLDPFLKKSKPSAKPAPSDKPKTVGRKPAAPGRSTVTDVHEKVNAVKGMQKLLDNGEIVIVQSAKDLPKKLAGDAQGVYDPETGKTYLVADALKPNQVQSVLLHEMTHRMFMQNPDVQAQMVGEVGEFSVIMSKIERGDLKGPYKRVFDAAMSRIPENTPQADRVEEFAAYVVSEFNSGATLPAHLAAWAKRVMAKIKAGLAAVGMPLKGISPADLDLAVRRTIAQKEPANPHLKRERALYSKAKDDRRRHWYKRPAGMSDIDQIRDKALWTKAKLLGRKWLTPEGNLDAKVYQLNTLRQGDNVAEDLEAKFLLKGFDKAVRGAYKHTLKSKLSVLDKATRRKLSDALKVPDMADMDPSIPDSVKVHLLAMRQHVDKLSMMYVDLVREEAVLGLQSGTPALRRAVLGARLIAENSEAVDAHNSEAKASGKDQPQRRKTPKAIHERTKKEVSELMDSSEDPRTLYKEAADIARKLGTIDTITHNAGRYVLRSYRMYEDGGLWLKKMPAKVKKTAADFVRSEMLEHNDKAAGWPAEKLENEVRKALENLIPDKARGGDSVASMIMAPKMGVDMQHILTRRKDIPVEIREYLGEYHDAAYNYAHTVEKVAHLATSKQFFNEVEKMGVGEFLFKDEDRPSGATTSLGGEKNQSIGALAGYYTFPEVAEAFTEHMRPVDLDGILGALVQFNSLAKINMTVYNPPTSSRNFISAGGFALMNGHLRPSKIKHAVKMGMSMLGAGGKEAKDYRKELSRLRVIGDGVRAGEVAQTFRDAKVYSLANDEIGESTATIASNAGRTLIRKFKGVFEGIYLFGDDFWKVIGFEATVSDLIKYKGLTREEAAPIAANQIRNTYPTYSMVGRGPKTLARFPGMGMFVSFPAEVLRTSPNIVRQVGHDWSNDMKIPAAKRATGIFVMTAGLAAMVTIARNLMGYDDEDDEAARVLGPEWMKNSTLMFLPRDEEGNMRYWDVSNTYAYNYYTRPLMALLRDQPFGTRLAEASKSLVTPFLGEEAGFKVLREVGTNRNEWGQKIYYETDPTPGSTVGPATKHIFDGMKPGFLKSQDRLAKGAEQYISGSGKQYSLSDEIWSFFGFRMTTVNPKVALFYKAYALSDAKRDATQLMKRVAAKDMNDVPEADIRSAWINANAIVYKAHQDLQTAIRASEKLGLSKKDKDWVLSDKTMKGAMKASGLSADAYEIIRSKGISKADMAALDSGEIPIWTPSDRFFDGMLSKIHLIISDEELQKTIEGRLSGREEYMQDLQQEFEDSIESKRQQQLLDENGLSVPDTEGLDSGEDLSSVLSGNDPEKITAYLSENQVPKDDIIRATKEISPAWADMLAQAPPDSVTLLKHAGVLS